MGITDFPQAGTLGVSQRPLRYDIEVYQEDSYEFQLRFATNDVPEDVTGWTGLCKVMSSTNTLIGTAVVSIVEPAADGIMLVNFDSVTGAAAGEHKYDVQITRGGKKRTIIGGKFTIVEDVSE